jgi:hypothetical protein
MPQRLPPPPLTKEQEDKIRESMGVADPNAPPTPKTIEQQAHWLVHDLGLANVHKSYAFILRMLKLEQRLAQLEALFPASMLSALEILQGKETAALKPGVDFETR